MMDYESSIRPADTLTPYTFSTDFRPSDIGSQFRTLEEMPDKVLRFMKLGQDKDEQTDRFLRMKKVHNRLETYGIKVADYDNYLGRDDQGDEAVITVVNKIDGTNLIDIELPPEEKERAYQCYISFFKGFFQYFIDSYGKPGDVIGDLKGYQFVYGGKSGEIEKNIYLVDVEPFMINGMPSEVDQRFLFALNTLVVMMDQAEEKINAQPYTVESFKEIAEPRTLLMNFLQRIEPAAAGLSEYQELKHGVSMPIEERVVKFNERANQKGNGWELINTA